MEVRSIRYFLLSLVFLEELGRLSAFNLDTENVLQKTGDPGSLFGFSLALHRQLDPVDKRMLLVGAPKAKSLRGQKAKVTGGLYNCDITSSSSGCERVEFDNDEDVRKESKEDQWMGVTVNSQGPGGKIVTCAHRYQALRYVGLPEESRDITGRCFILSQDLSVDPQAEEDGGRWHFCEGRAHGHERFGSCQQGLSATFDKDFHYFIFGAPGAYNWKGVVRAEQKNNTLIDLGLYDDGPFEVGDENQQDPDLVPVPANSYLGFSLDSGQSLTKKGQLTVVAGAPRANHSGAVVLLKKDSDDGASLVAEYILEGEGLASSFGYDLTVLDLNGDGWQDIVVGAPQYFEKDKEVGGAIYAYTNKKGAWNKVTPTRIDGPHDSMFGLAVENLGDVNQDGFQDVAVGAPYDDDGAGNVFIYHGSADGINPKPTQVLSSPVGMKLFGYSLAGNLDLDRNVYPDLAVGSLSDSVFVYRARPVISIHKTINTKPKELDLTKKNCGNNICLEVELCLSYTANPKAYSPSLVVEYTFEVEGERRKLGLGGRVTFSKRSSDEYRLSGTVTLAGQGQSKCVTQRLTLQDNIKDKLRGIPIEVSVDIKKANRRRRQSSLSELTPILDSNQPSTAQVEVSFVKEGCGRDNVCQSNLELKYRFCERTEPNKDVFSPLPLEKGLPVVSLSDAKDIALEITVTNENGDDAYESALVASFPPSLSYAAFRMASDRPVSCSPNYNGSQAECDLGNPFNRDSKVTFYIILSTAGISLDTTELEVDLKLETTSDQQKIGRVLAKATVVIELQLSVTGQAQPSQVEFSGKVKGMSAMKTESDVGSAIRYQFKVINLGKPMKTSGTASLIIQWPKETADGKWLLYLMRIESSGLGPLSCSPESEINPLTLKEEHNSSTRRRRSVDDTDQEGSIAFQTDQRKSQILSCDSGARCVELRCPLQGLDSNAVVTLHSRLWNGTFLENFSKLNYLDVLVKASLRVDGTAQNMVLRNAETQARVTVFPERRAAQYGGLPWWIILVAILLGLLLLALLVFLLWKCGFFKRSKYEDRVPSHTAQRIRRQEGQVGRPGGPGGPKPETSQESKPWMTSWSDNESYS